MTYVPWSSEMYEDYHLLRACRSVPMDVWLKMEAELCKCENLCTCGWDDLEETDE